MCKSLIATNIEKKHVLFLSVYHMQIHLSTCLICAHIQYNLPFQEFKHVLLARETDCIINYNTNLGNREIEDHSVTGDPHILTGFISSPLKDSVPELFLNHLGGFYLLMPIKKNQ